MKRFFYSILLLILICGSSLRANEPKVHPVMILGGGVGALTSAVYLQRAGIETLVIEGSTPGGAIAQSPLVHNWPGEIEINGQDLVDKIRNQAIFNGAQILAEEVIEVDYSNRPFIIKTREVLNHSKLHVYKTNACVVATGTKHNFLGVPGESGDKGYWTRGVYSCAVCDGPLYKDKTVAVIGGGDSAIIEADYLSNIAKKVYIVLRSDKFRSIETLRKNELLKKSNVEVLYNTKISEIHGDGKKVTHLNLSTDKNLPIDGVFVAIGATPNSAIFKGQLELEETGYVVTKDGLQTSVPGVFVIGDVVDKVYKQAITAAGDGAKAALRVESYLSTSPKQPPRVTIQPQVVKAKNEVASDSFPDIQSKEEFYNTITSGQTPVFVDFYSPVCGQCCRLLPELEKIAEMYQGKLRFFKINVAEFSELAGKYQIQSVPTVLVFDNQGKVLARATGPDDIHKVLKKLDSITSKVSKP